MALESTPPWLIEHDLERDALIGLISDTHIPEARATLFDEVYEAFREVDLLLTLVIFTM